MGTTAIKLPDLVALSRAAFVEQARRDLNSGEPHDVLAADLREAALRLEER